MQYRREIDGLRAVAVIPVVLFHAGVAGFSGGFVGVDVFFVISGYLITSILLSDISRGSFSITRFYERRARRILPALLVVVLASVLLGWKQMTPYEFAELGKSIAAVGVFGSNIFFWRASGYFQPDAETFPLLHTWSLAVEEQFYIIFPFFLFVAWRVCNGVGSRMVALVAIALVASFALSDWAAWHKGSANFFLLPTRAWELLTGTVCALFLYSRGKALIELAEAKTGFQRTLIQSSGMLGILMIAASVAVYSADTPFPSRYALLPVVGTALIILFAGPRTFAGTLLGTKLLVGIGLISYSVYLWHQPLLAFARIGATEDLPPWQVAGLIALTFTLAYLSWQYVEKPLRFTRRYALATRSGALAAGALAMGLLVAAGGTMYQLDGFSYRYDRYNKLAYRWNNQILLEESWSILRSMSDDKEYGVVNNAFDRSATFDEYDPRHNVLLVGNSHSKDLFNTFHFSKSVQSEFEVFRYGAQIESLASENDFYASPLFRDAETVVLTTKYSGNDMDVLQKVVRRISGLGKNIMIASNTAEFPNTSRETLADEVIMDLMKTTSGEPTPRVATQTADHVNSLYWDAFHDNARLEELNGELERVARENGLEFLDRTKLVCAMEERLCLASSADLGKYFYDYGHFTLLGAKRFAQRVDDTDWFNRHFAHQSVADARISRYAE